MLRFAGILYPLTLLYENQQTDIGSQVPLKFGLILASYPDVLPISLSRKSEGDIGAWRVLPTWSASLHCPTLWWRQNADNAQGTEPHAYQGNQSYLLTNSYDSGKLLSCVYLVKSIFDEKSLMNHFLSIVDYNGKRITFRTVVGLQWLWDSLFPLPF